MHTITERERERERERALFNNIYTYCKQEEFLSLHLYWSQKPSNNLNVFILNKKKKTIKRIKQMRIRLKRGGKVNSAELLKERPNGKARLFKSSFIDIKYKMILKCYNINFSHKV